MKIGTEVDLAIKAFITTGEYGKVKSQEAKSCLEGFKQWYADHNKPSLRVGQRLFNEESKLTGEPDFYWGDRIIDIKCAREIRPKYHVQTGAYAWLDKKNSTGILRLHKHLQDYEYVERDGQQVKKDSDCFLNLFNAFTHLTSLVLPVERGHNADSTPNTTF